MSPYGHGVFQGGISGSPVALCRAPEVEGFGYSASLIVHIVLMQGKKRGWRVEAEEKGNSCLMHEKICQTPMVRFNSWVLQAQKNNVIYVIIAKRLV